MKYLTTIGGREYLVEVVDESHVILDGKMYVVDFDPINDQPVYSLIVDGQSHEAYVYSIEEGWQVLLRGTQYLARVEDERERRLRKTAEGTVSEREFMLKAPMPGLVIAVPVSEGQEVKKGDVLVILESMKMQNELKSPRSGVVMRVKVRPGESVEQRQTLLSVV